MLSTIICISILAILIPLVIYAEIKKARHFRREQKELVDELHKMIDKHEKLRKRK